MASLHLLRRLLMALAMAQPLAAIAQGPPSEHAVKAAYLVKLRNYVEWPARPAGADTRTVIGVLGADDVAEHLAQMPSLREAAKTGLVLRRLRLGDPVAGVNILFVGDSSWNRAAAMVAQARSQATLVVSESDSACRRQHHQLSPGRRTHPV